MKFKLIEKGNPSQPSAPKKYYPSAVNAGKVTVKDFTKEIAGRSSLTRGDIENVLSNFIDELPTFLKLGMSVQLGDFGTLRLNLSDDRFQNRNRYGKSYLYAECGTEKRIGGHSLRKRGSVMKKILLSTILAIGLATGAVQTTQAQTAATDPDVVINGVTWATRNVDAPGAFAAAPESAGMFYQWGSNIGWSATDPLTASDGNNTWRDVSNHAFQIWFSTNDPCPNGWRVPTVDEMDSWQIAPHNRITQNGIIGYLFTDNISGNSIFLSAAGKRVDMPYNGALLWAGENGYYWTSYMFYNGTGY
jgi:nucleoid DNA-binding protein